MTFIKDIIPAAQRIFKEDHILASLILAQACLESNFGQSGLAVKGKNLFGVKGEYNGQCVTMATTEYKNDTPYRIDAAFRKYPSWYESMKDLADLYKNGVSWDHNKYHAIIGEKDFEKAARAVQAAGYATDPSYAAKLLGIYKQNNLGQYDKTAESKPASKPAAKEAPKPVYYTVKKGDVVSRIALKYSTTVKHVADLNKLKNPDLIHPGQKLRVK